MWGCSTNRNFSIHTPAAHLELTGTGAFTTHHRLSPPHPGCAFPLLTQITLSVNTVKCPNHKLVNDSISFASIVERERLFLVYILPMKITFCCPRSMNWLRGFTEQSGGGRNGSPLNPKAKSQSSHLRSKAKTWVPQIYRWKVFSVEGDSSYLTMLGKHYEKENPQPSPHI